MCLIDCYQIKESSVSILCVFERFQRSFPFLYILYPGLAASAAPRRAETARREGGCFDEYIDYGEGEMGKGKERDGFFGGRGAGIGVLIWSPRWDTI